MNNVIEKKCQDFFHIPEFKKLTETPQSPVYHGEGNVAIHTDMVCDALLQLPEWSLLSEKEQIILYYTALFHDVAKGFTLTWENGVPRHPHHSMKGAFWWRQYAWKNNIDIVVRESVASLILLHQKLFHIWNKEDYKRELFKYSSHIPLKWLTIFAKADIQGRIAPDISQHLESLDLVEIWAKEHLIWEQRNNLSAIERVEWLRHRRGDGVTPMYNGRGSLVHIMIGLPASGKDTFVQKNFKDLPIISFDQQRVDFGLKYGQDEGRVKQAVLQKAKILLSQKKEFVWNTTNTSFNTLDKTLELLYSYDSYVKGYVLNVDYQEHMKRNHKRDSSVSQKVIMDMADKWNIPTMNDLHEVHFYHNGQLIQELSQYPVTSVTPLSNF